MIQRKAQKNGTILYRYWDVFMWDCNFND